MLTITRALVRVVRNHHWNGRHALIVTLGVLLALGTVATVPTKAYAAVTEVRTALHAGVDASGPLAVVGADPSSVVLGTHRTTTTGASWSTDALLSASTWQMAVNGSLVGYQPSAASYKAVVYAIGTGAQTLYDLPAAPSSMSGSWSLTGSGPYVAYNFVNKFFAVPNTPTGVSVSNVSAQLAPSDAVLWKGTTASATPAFAVAASPSAAAPTWVTIDGSTGAVATPTQLVYVLGTTTSVQICSRPLTSLSSAPTCSTVLTGSFDTVRPQFSSFGNWTIVNIWTGLGATGHYTPYIWNGAWATATKITLPAGSYIDQPTSAGVDTYGDTPFILVRDTNTIPTIQRVLMDGSLSTVLPLPPTAASSVGFLSVAPDRVVGADTRDGSIQLPSWTRTVSASGFGAETVLPVRTSGLSASAGRTVVSGPSGLSVYDRGTLRNTLADARVSDLSGPYLTRLGWNTAADSPEVEIATVDNTTVATFLGTAGSLFGSEYVTWTNDAVQSGSAHVVITDLTGAAAPRSVTLPAGSAPCTGGRAWGSTLFMSCGSSKLEAFDLRTGALTSTLSAPTGQFVNLMDVGDGYAVVTFNNADYTLWNSVTSTQTALTDCSYDVTSDGVGHVGCSSSTQLIWRDFSALATNAPLLLGTLAGATADFSNPGSTWSIELDATKPLKAGTLVISKADGTPVRTLVTPASADGSIRGLTWDGFDATNKPVPAGQYTYKLVADAVDGSGAVVSSVSSATQPAPASGKVTVTSANPAGMDPGALLSVSPSRLLDTRTTGGPVTANSTRQLKVTGVGGVPSTGVSAVVLNVTVTETSNSGYLTVSPSGTTRPVVSNLNWTGGLTIPNAVTVKVGAGGYVDLYQSGPGSAQVIVDVAGYFLSGTVADAGGFTPLTPARLLDTRTVGGKVAANTSRDLQVTGNGGVPATNVSAVVLNVTVTETTSGGYLTVYPTGTTKPLASNLNWGGGATIPNLVTVQLGTGGKVSLYQSGPGTAQVIVDVAGYYLGGTPVQPGMFVALAPTRVLDTRTTGKIAGGADATLAILGKGGIPGTGVSAVVVNTTVTETAAPGYLTVYPGTNPLPTASNLNWTGGVTIPNLVTVQTGSDGTIKFHNGSGGTTQIIADSAGYYIGS